GAALRFCPLHRLPYLSTAPATPPPSTLSLHDALPISADRIGTSAQQLPRAGVEEHQGVFLDPDRDPAAVQDLGSQHDTSGQADRSEEHTSELQSRENIACRLPHAKKTTSRRGSLRDAN